MYSVSYLVIFHYFKPEVHTLKKHPMLALVIPVNIFLLGGILLGAFLIGFFLRTAQMKSLKKKVWELENEMLRNHAEILEIQKEKSFLEQKLKDMHIPVISMNPSKDENNNAKSPEVTLRKMAQQPGGIAKHS
jgi:hypothetical protein